MLLPIPPPVPPYEATKQDVEDFLVAYSISQFNRSDKESLEMAQKLPVDGPGLFGTSEEKIREIYGCNARMLIRHLQSPISIQVYLTPIS